MNYYIWYLVWFQGKCAISYHIFSDCYLQHFSQNSCVVLYPTKPYWRYVVTWYWLLTIRQATGHNLNPSWPSSVNQWPTADHVRYYQFYSLHINNVNVWYILNAVFMDSVISYKYNTLVLTRCGLVTIYIYIYIYMASCAMSMLLNDRKWRYFVHARFNAQIFFSHVGAPDQNPDDGKYAIYHSHSIVFFIKYHDDVVKWKHFPRYWSFMRGIHRSPVNSPHKGQWRGALMFSLIYAWINGWVNNREAGDLSRNRAHHDVIIMTYARKGMYRSDDQMWSAGLINFVFTEILWGFNSERVFILWCRHAWWLLHWLYIVWFQGKCTISKHIFSDCYLEHFSQNSWPWLRCPSMLDCKKNAVLPLP